MVSIVREYLLSDNIHYQVIPGSNIINLQKTGQRTVPCPRENAMNIHTLIKTPCPCGRDHTASVKDVLSGPGVIAQLPSCAARLNAKKPFLLSDVHTQKAAGQTVRRILDEAGIAWSGYVIEKETLPPDEWVVGSAVMHYDPSCDLIIGIGSGVINDTCKLLASVSGNPYIIVATAPSMDGYASATSSMDRDELKCSLPSRCADIIIGDTDILCQAPLHMLSSGIGDMIAKYVSITEWRISHVINGEYYCEQIAQLVRSSLAKCTANADGLMKRDPEAVQAVFEGLIITGIAMAYAGVSRPASGSEHYFSHVWDMRALQFGTPSEMHGIQCAMAALPVVRLYEWLEHYTPDPEKARAFVSSFDYDEWKTVLRSFLGESAETMIALEQREGKYDKTKHPARLHTILEHWDELVRIMKEELPASHELEALLEKLHIPTELSALDIDSEKARLTFLATKDIRDKYVLARLAWDLGVTDELCALL